MMNVGEVRIAEDSDFALLKVNFPHPLTAHAFRFIFFSTEM